MCDTIAIAAHTHACFGCMQLVCETALLEAGGRPSAVLGDIIVHPSTNQSSVYHLIDLAHLPRCPRVLCLCSDWSLCSPLALDLVLHALMCLWIASVCTTVKGTAMAGVLW